MGERGPAPKPTAIRELEGNPGHRPINRSEPKPEGEAICPEWLSADAKDEWARVAPELTRMGLLTMVDTAALAAYCVAYGRWKEAELQIVREGHTFVTAAGYVAQHPAVGIANKAMEQIHKFCKEFGLTPSSRGRMTVPGKAEELNPMAQLLGAPALTVVQ